MCQVHRKILRDPFILSLQVGREIDTAMQHLITTEQVVEKRSAQGAVKTQGRKHSLALGALNLGRPPEGGDK